MTWRQLEVLVDEHFRQQEFQVNDDEAVDLVLQLDGDTYLVQCVHGKVQQAGSNPARELLGLMAGHRATEGYSGGTSLTKVNDRLFLHHENAR